MTWNNRIIRSRHIVTNSKEELDIYGLYEVYYDALDDNDEPTVMWTKEPMFGYFDSVEELIGSLEMMLKDAKRCKDDILDLEELQKKYGVS